MVLPDLVAKNDDIVSPGLTVLVEESPANFRTRPQQGEKLSGDIGHRNLCRITSTCQVCRSPSGKGRDASESLVLFTEPKIVAVGNSGLPRERSARRR